MRDVIIKHKQILEVVILVKRRIQAVISYCSYSLIVALLLLPLLPPQPVRAAASIEYELLGTHPQANAQATAVGKTLHKLQPFDNKIYVGYGDAAANTGPVELNPFDLDSEAFTGSELQIPSEEINKFRIIGGKLLTPMIDKRGCLVCANGYAEGPPFANRTPVSAVHIFDVNTLNGTDRWLVGSSDQSVDGAHVWRSENGVDNWEVVQAETNDFINGSEQYRWIEVLNGKIYMQAGDVVDESWQQAPVRIFDGENWTTGTNEIISLNNKTIVFDNKIISTTSGLSAFDGETFGEVTSFPGAAQDMYVDGEYLYVLRTNATLTRTNNLEDWQELGPTVNNASSVAVYDSRVYIGTTASTLHGSITALPTFTPDSQLVSGESTVAPLYQTRYGTGGYVNISASSIAVDSADNRYIVDRGDIVKLAPNGDYLDTLDSSNMEDFGEGASEIFIDTNDNLYIPYGYGVKKYNLSGDLLLEFGTEGSGDGEFGSTPSSAVADAEGNIYVGDSTNKNVQKFNSSGVFQLKWGTEGSGDGEFGSVGDLAVDSNNNIYVTDFINLRIQKFNSSGVFQLGWGSYGSGNSEFLSPTSMVVDSNDNVIVLDRDNGRAQKFASDSTFLAQISEFGAGVDQLGGPDALGIDSADSLYIADFDGSETRIKKFASDGTYVSFTNTQLEKPAGFYNPSGIAIDADGFIYVADTGNNRIQKLDQNGEYVLQWGGPGDGNGELQGPVGVSVGPDGSVYVADTQNHRIQKFDSDGNYISQFGSQGNGNGELDTPYAVRFDDEGNIYVVEYDPNNRIQKFDQNGNYISQFGSYGTGAGELYGPSDMAFDSEGNIYVSEFYNQRIQKFSADGEYVSAWGYDGSTANGEFQGPSGIVIDGQDNVYVADSNNRRVQKFTSDGLFLTKFGSYGLEDNQFIEAAGIALSDDNNLYVVDQIGGEDTGGAIKKWSYNVTDGLAGGDISVRAPYATNLTCSEQVLEDDLAAQDDDKEYPLGLVDFCLEVTPGSTHTMTIIFKTALKPSEVVARKYDPNSDTYDNV